ncbi:MAG: DMT family transporter [Lachnospiraceae bacterium]
MKRNQPKNTVMLFLAALIWGFAFVAQSAGMDHVGPFTFNFFRTLLGGLVLLPAALSVSAGEKGREKQTGKERKTLLIGGICCGLLLCIATNLQQIGIMSTTAGKAGFLTAAYIVFVPVFGMFLKKKCGWNVWVSVVIALVGMYLLCIKESFSIAIGDIYILICAVIFAVHIMVVDYFAPKVDGVALSCIQFFVCSVFSGILMLAFEKVSLTGLLGAAVPILYAGILSCGVAYTFQILGQKNYNPSIAALILSLESAFSVLGGFLILHEELSRKELAGCALMFAAIVLTQLPVGQKKEKTEE